MKKITWLVITMMALAPMVARAGEGLTLKSDLRLRYEYKDADGKMNRGRARFRLRINGEHQIDDNWTVGFRLASGSDPDPTSPWTMHSIRRVCGLTVHTQSTRPAISN